MKSIGAPTIEFMLLGTYRYVKELQHVNSCRAGTIFVFFGLKVNIAAVFQYLALCHNRAGARQLPPVHPTCFLAHGVQCCAQDVRSPNSVSIETETETETHAIKSETRCRRR